MSGIIIEMSRAATEMANNNQVAVDNHAKNLEWQRRVEIEAERLSLKFNSLMTYEKPDHRPLVIP